MNRTCCVRALAAITVSSLALSARPAAGRLLLIADGAAILSYDAYTGAAQGAFTTGHTLSDPDGLAFGPNGNLFVTDFGLDQVLQFNGTTGAFISTFATPANSPYALAFGPGGNLFVGESGGAIQQFNGTTGASLGTFIAAPPSQSFGGGVDLGGLAFNGGSLFVS